VAGQSDTDCDADCTAVICGDGFINRAAGEQCDDGDQTATNDCFACVLMKCGDGVRGAYEQCDDGNRVPGDGCGADCQRECGNGRINADEHCDDGDLDDDDECTNDCTFGPTVLLDNEEVEGQECASVPTRGSIRPARPSSSIGHSADIASGP
jgi:cysteine-rich repeat protein